MILVFIMKSQILSLTVKSLSYWKEPGSLKQIFLFQQQNNQERSENLTSFGFQSTLGLHTQSFKMEPSVSYVSFLVDSAVIKALIDLLSFLIHHITTGLEQVTSSKCMKKKEGMEKIGL